MKRQLQFWIFGTMTFLLITSFALKPATSDKVVVIEENVVYLLNFDYSFTTTTGSDGVKISYPYGWNTSTGSDGRKIAYPYGWNTSTGSDGRKIAYPYGWNTSTGSDGRKIAYPYGWNTSTGSDGRKIAYPYGWNTSTGSDGRKIAYPYGWNTSTGSDGRKIAYPYGWPIDNSGQRKYAEIQETTSGGIAIVFQSVENSERIQELIDDDEMEDAYEYALYILINENY